MPPDQTTALHARGYKGTRTTVALMLREMSATYGKSPGGYVWAVAEPIAAITVLSLGFLLVFKVPRLGTNFPLYFATGYLPFILAIDIGNKVATSLRFSKSLLAYPMVRYTDAIFARIFLSVVTNFVVAAILLSGIHIVFNLQSIVEPASVVKSVALAIVLGTGFGAFNCYMFFALPIWERLWSVVTRPLALASGVVFLYDTMPPGAQEVVWYNPYTHVVGMMRRAFYPTYEASYVSQTYVFGIALTFMAFGFLLLRRHEKAMIHN